MQQKIKNWMLCSLLSLAVVHAHTHLFRGPLDFVWDYPGEPVPEPIWILLKQETVNGSSISWAICKSAPRPSQITLPAPHHSVFRSSPERWLNKPSKNVRPSVRMYVRPSVHMSTVKHNAATNQIVVFVMVNETFTTIWLSPSKVRVKVRRWPWDCFYRLDALPVA